MVLVSVSGVAVGVAVAVAAAIAVVAALLWSHLLLLVLLLLLPVVAGVAVPPDDLFLVLRGHAECCPSAVRPHLPLCSSAGSSEGCNVKSADKRRLPGSWRNLLPPGVRV